MAHQTTRQHTRSINIADKTIKIYERDLKTLTTPTKPTRQTTLTYHGRQTKTSLAAIAAETVAHELRNRGILEINRMTQRVYTVHSPHAPNRLAEIASYEIC